MPGNHQSAGKRKHGRPRKGNQHLQPLLVEAAWSAVHTDTRLKARYHRLVLGFGGYHNPPAKKKAIIAVAHTLLVIIWHVLATGKPYTDLGADFYTRRADPEKETRRLIARLEAPSSIRSASHPLHNRLPPGPGSAGAPPGAAAQSGPSLVSESQLM